MAKALITHERLLELLSYEPETGYFRWRVKRPKCVVGDLAGCINKLGYHVIRVDGVLYLAHRLAWLYVHKVWPIGVDHEFGKRGVVPFCELREASQNQNAKNQRKSIRNTSGLKGVSLHRPNGRWHAQIVSDGQHYSLGYYKEKEQAHRAYQIGARILHGKFANFG